MLLLYLIYLILIQLIIHILNNCGRFKKDGVKWVFIDEVWSAIRDINIYIWFQVCIIWWFLSITQCWAKPLWCFNSEVFAEICDGPMLELTRNYRAENDVDFAEFIADLKIVKIQ